MNNLIKMNGAKWAKFIQNKREIYMYRSLWSRPLSLIHGMELPSETIGRAVARKLISDCADAAGMRNARQYASLLLYCIVFAQK